MGGENQKGFWWRVSPEEPQYHSSAGFIGLLHVYQVLGLHVSSGVGVHTHNLSTWVAETGGLQVQGHIEHHRKILSQNTRPSRWLSGQSAYHRSMMNWVWIPIIHVGQTQQQPSVAGCPICLQGGRMCRRARFMQQQTKDTQTKR